MGLIGTWPALLRNFIVRHLEFLFILLMALIVVAVFYLLPYKIAFLNFFSCRCCRRPTSWGSDTR